jgi:hypothetical protein
MRDHSYSCASARVGRCQIPLKQPLPLPRLASGKPAQVSAFTCGCFERLVVGREHRGRSRLRAVARKHRNSPEEVVQAELARERLEEAARVALEVQARAKKMQLMALLPLLVIPVAGAENGIFF